MTKRSQSRFIIDFGTSLDLATASRYEAPFEIIKDNVLPKRRKNNRANYAQYWWRHMEPRPAMRNALAPQRCFLATPTVSKHRLFAWLQSPTLPDHQLIVFSPTSELVFGLLHSRIHEVWARRQGTQLRERSSGFRYTPTSCYSTFPYPVLTEQQEIRIAEAASELAEVRSQWLNPPEWTREEALEFPGTATGPWRHWLHNTDAQGIGTVHWRRRVPLDDDAKDKLAARTLTKLYNRRPEWLERLHQKLDEAVADAYGWPVDLEEEEILSRLLQRNLELAS